jgi:hypothetical protein
VAAVGSPTISTEEATMSDELRVRMHQELADRPRPAFDGVVEAAMSAGRRSRRNRRAVSGLGTTAVVGIAVAVVVASSQAAPGRTTAVASPGAGGTTPVAATTTAAPTAAAPTTTAPTTTAAVAKPAPVAAGKTAPPGSAVTPATYTAAPPPGVRATTGGMLALLTSQLPAGWTSSSYGAADDSSLMVEANLTNASGTGMVRIALFKDMVSTLGCGVTFVCHTEANGDVVEVSHLADNCIESTSVSVIHTDGSGVEFNIASCLEWNGTANVASPQVLTEAEAIALGSDPRWDLSMDPSLVAKGAQDFANLHQFS